MTFLKGNIPWNRGKHWSEDIKNKIRKKHRGKHHSPQTEFKIGIIPWSKGRKGFFKHTEEYKKNLTERMKGNNFGFKKGNIPKNPFQKGHIPWSKGKHLIPWNIGKHHSENTRQKIRKANKGKHYSPKTEFKKEQTSGKNNWNWKGGISPERQSFYASQEWARVVPIIWSREKKTCQRCNKKYKQGDQFHIHHKIGFEVKELRTNPENLVLLCRKCHYWVHSKKNKNKEFLE